MILILDYGMGNSFSIKNMLYRVGLDSLISNNIDEINRAKKIIMPGVGAFDAAIDNIEKLTTLAIVESLMREIKNSISTNEGVYLRGFGTFKAKKRAEKTGRNIKKNTTIIIPAHHIPAFKPAKVFVEKNPTDEIFAANAEVKITPVAMVP